MPARRVFNPFYVLLTLVGVAFVITACLYGVMTVRMLDPFAAEAASANAEAREHALMTAVDKHGALAMAIEVGVLGVLTVLAITTDDFWTRRAAQPTDSTDIV